MWEFLYSISFINIAFALAYEFGTRDMSNYTDIKSSNSGLRDIASAIVVFDMVMSLVTEKRYTETILLKRIPDVSKLYLKK
jgi:hypothetical protein